jgi:hypothetical protein
MDFLNRIKELQDITLYYYTSEKKKKKKKKKQEVNLLIGIGVNVMLWCERQLVGDER